MKIEKGSIYWRRLKELRDYMDSGDWKKNGAFDMRSYWNARNKCGCLLGHGGYEATYYLGQCSNYEWKIWIAFYQFLFSHLWVYYDNTPEGAVGRIDAVLNGLEF